MYNIFDTLIVADLYTVTFEDLERCTLYNSKKKN